MTIKSDRWITRMAREHGMIEPFEGRQVREGVISYGVSSYGYDIRIADEFKIFTNVNSAIVDPKNFDPQSFVDFKGDVCIIPPNSFALGKTVEYFRIPRDVLTICVGKSTYARCFRGDTRISLVDGTAPTIEELARRSESGELFFGYSIGQNGRMIVSLLEHPRYIGRDALIEVSIDNGESVYCTPDHKWMLRDGRMIEAHLLRPRDSLMPLYRQLFRGYEMAYQPLNGHLYPTHRMADEWNLRHQIYPDIPGTHRHHIDIDRRNNNPWNIRRMEAGDHIRLHNAESYGEDFDPAEHSASIRSALSERARDPDWVAHYGRVQSERAIRFWSDEAYADTRERLIELRRTPSDETREAFRRFPDVVQAFKGTRPQRNHKVVGVRNVPGDHDVYCLTVPEAGNFALEAGVFVGNCGLIVNVTPFEPEWQGYVTLEISNTTPLPAKIYANEGIAQVLFFQSDEPCEVSYADKKGKYQSQQGLVLPKI